ncbi:uncharacterized protein LOC111054673 isoform X1 [Nilaparvata lugens]|uniref:uncharacterized protein LOC111054673 isoform X1 n=1 Tax=Nilaparvata lugens TaxID=108931 RepID=UPI00193CC12D|nr:uncharacterized protein LOC111054673 isoform X1 [Nilaparvata lugens]XP_039276512.1 uncharacterized protein LOC111054673 isoform X1 [Nilaparvata lugens]
MEVRLKCSQRWHFPSNFHPNIVPTLFGSMLPLIVIFLIANSDNIDSVAASAQVSWTPIHLDSSSQIDLWTQKASGCPCSYAPDKNDCACCVQDGGCHCGEDSPHRCAQCGLTQYCTSMCNMTLDSRALMSSSNKTFGQIKSPADQGPFLCWYNLQPDTGQRVEIQIYRLVSVGKFNGTHCESGFVQLVEGGDPVVDPAGTQICGGNERFSPPVVLFGDKGTATLIFQITEYTVRSQFLAYFSFTSVNSTGVGFQPMGGRRLEHTDCDWLYQDFLCREPGSCKLASPGFPGIYAPRRRCRYHVTISSMHTWVRLKFLSLYLPHSHCNQDNVKIYQGATNSSALVATLCGNRKKQELNFPGPNLLIEFSSGPAVPPFDYNGFMASLEFWHKPVSTEAPTTTQRVTEQSVLSKSLDAKGNNAVQSTARPACELVFNGNESRSGHFDSRKESWHQNCSFVFIGKPSDVVHVSLFNYKLKSPSCQSTIEIYDGLQSEGRKPTKKICSPSTKHAQDPSGKFHEQQLFVSSGPVLNILLRRMPTHQTSSQSEQEFLDGAYVFHDEHIGGTLQPDALCNVDYFGMSASTYGTVTNAGNQHVFWNVEGPLECSHRFIPAANQSVTVQLVSLGKLRTDPRQCHTRCGDSACQCETDLLPLSQIDHIMFMTDTQLTLSCICGNFEEDWLPVGVRSWSPVRVVYHLAHYSWTSKGFQFRADYSFTNDAMCGHQVLTQHLGVIDSADLQISSQLNYFYHQSCTWLLDSNVERQLTVELSSNQNRQCSAWNLSIHEYSEQNEDRTGTHLYTFCSREKHKNYSLPWKLNIVVIK